MSIQKHKPPSFFLTSTTALHHTLWLGCMAPASSISHKCLWTSSTKGGGICLNHSLKGVSSVTLITCSVEQMQPSSVGSNEKTSWYSAKNHQSESANSGDHNSKPLRSRSFEQFPLPLSNGQLRCVRALRLIYPLQQPGLSQLFWHCSCGHSSGHWGFLLESLEVGRGIPHHHDCVLATFPQLGVHILHGETLR